MFRVKDSKGTPSSLSAERVLALTLLLALSASGVLAYLIVLEYRHLSVWQNSPDAVPVAVVESLREDVVWQLVGSLIVSAILLSCIAAIWWLRRRFFASQESLRHVKMLAHDILASMDRGVVTTDCQGSITSINSAGIRLLAVDFECVGRPLACISSPVVPLVEVYRKVTEDQAAVRDLDATIERSGRTLQLRVDGHLLKDLRGTVLGCVLHLRDVTERGLLEDRMRRMERFISLTALASGLHHEIKNPLTALSIHIQLLEEALAKGADAEPLDEFVEVLKTEVCRLNGVLESFRTFANLQHLSLQPTDAFGVLEDAIRLIRPQAAQQGVRIALQRPEQALPPVPLDAEKFEQALLNLIINALEAMPEGGNLTVGAGVEDGALRVSVQDDGPGIPPEVQGHLFEPYFSTKNKGTGMGLALSEKLISQHGGRIGFRTGPAGTAFDITLPLEPRSDRT